MKYEVEMEIKTPAIETNFFTIKKMTEDFQHYCEVFFGGKSTNIFATGALILSVQSSILGD